MIHVVYVLEFSILSSELRLLICMLAQMHVTLLSNDLNAHNCYTFLFAFVQRTEHNLHKKALLIETHYRWISGRL